jgi:hypothetical protein
LADTPGGATTRSGPRAPTLVLLDADTVAGWRRAEPSLEQLRRARADLVAEHSDLRVAVLADPAIKWALPESEHDDFERAIVARDLVCAPAGTRDGHDGWVAAVIAQARANGETVVMVTDRALAGVPVARLRFEGGRFRFDLEGASEVSARAAPQWRRRRR